LSEELGERLCNESEDMRKDSRYLA
jgi:hypothetical protein